jgi:IclR family pca regulon transcriptional regulator
VSSAAVNGRRLPIASLEKSLRVLDALARARHGASVADLVERTGLERTTVQRILRTIHAEGYVERTGRGEYAIAPRAYVMGAMLVRSNQLAAAARPVLRRLQRATGETVNLAVLDGTNVLSLEHLAADKLLVSNFAVGQRLPAYASSLGRAMLANLSEPHAAEILRLSDRDGPTDRTIVVVSELAAELECVRRQGFALVDGEVEYGLCAAAAPVLDRTGSAVAAINVVAPAARADAAKFRASFVAPLIDSAAEISDRLAQWTA